MRTPFLARQPQVCRGFVRDALSRANRGEMGMRVLAEHRLRQIRLDWGRSLSLGMKPTRCHANTAHPAGRDCVRFGTIDETEGME
jgi:hypothetical protein